MKHLLIRKLLVVNENILNADLSRNEIGRRLESLWENAHTRVSYGNTELGFCGAECSAHKGYHIHPAAHYFEVVHPEINRPLPEGKPGRFVVTSLLYRGLPLIRYAIDDVTFLVRKPCECGITSERFGPILGRLDQMLKIKGGVSTYPPIIENLLLSLPFIEDYYFEAYSDELNRQNIRIYIAPAQNMSSKDAALYVQKLFRQKLSFTPEVEIASPETIQAKTRVRGKRKAQRFHDLRKT